MTEVKRRVPPGKKPVALVMQGGGALGAYEWGAVTGLCEAGFHPVAVAGVSIGAVNAAAIAGAPGGDVVASLAELWRRLMIHTPPFMPRAMAEMIGVFGNPAMYSLRTDWHAFPSWTAYCDVSPLRRTLEDVCQFHRINDPTNMGFAVTATSVQTGQLKRFANDGLHRTPITADHVLASGALPPGFPMAEVNGEPHWDGGLFDNTPVRPMFDLLTEREADEVPIVLINLFPDGTSVPPPRNMAELWTRKMELTYENRFWDDYGGKEGLHAWAAMIAEVDRALPPDAPIRRDPQYRLLRMRRCLGNLHVIESDHVPMTGGMDFSADTVRKRFRLGREAAERYLGSGRLDRPPVAFLRETVEGRSGDGSERLRPQQADEPLGLIHDRVSERARPDGAGAQHTVHVSGVGEQAAGLAGDGAELGD